MDDLLQTKSAGSKDPLELLTDEELNILIDFGELPVFNVLRKLQRSKRDLLLNDIMKMKSNIPSDFVIREISKIQGEYKNNEEFLKTPDLAKQSIKIRNKENGQGNTSN